MGFFDIFKKEKPRRELPPIESRNIGTFWIVVKRGENNDLRFETRVKGFGVRIPHILKDDEIINDILKIHKKLQAHAKTHKKDNCETDIDYI